MTRSRVLSLTLVAVLALGVGGYLAYDKVLRGDSVEPLALPSASAAASAAAPNVGGFIVSIADEGALEFLVVLARA